MGNCVKRVGTENFDFPTQVEWRDVEKHILYCGIGYNDIIICSCCGGIIPQDEWKDLTDLVAFGNWVDFTPYIMAESLDELLEEEGL